MSVLKYPRSTIPDDVSKITCRVHIDSHMTLFVSQASHLMTQVDLGLLMRQSSIANRVDRNSRSKQINKITLLIDEQLCGYSVKYALSA